MPVSLKPKLLLTPWPAAGVGMFSNPSEHIPDPLPEGPIPGGVCA